MTLIAATLVGLLVAVASEPSVSHYLTEPTTASALSLLALLGLLFVVHYAVAFLRGPTEPGALGPDELDDWFGE